MIALLIFQMGYQRYARKGDATSNEGGADILPLPKVRHIRIFQMERMDIFTSR